MNRFAMILTVVILPAWVLPAPAVGLFGKKTKANPAERVPELVLSVKTEQDERKRASAAAELGTFDAGAFAEIVPVLVDVLQNDPKAGVRMDAASSLGSLRPVSQLAGQALEKAVSSDDNWRVRWHAKGILMKYRIAGYSSGSKGDARNPIGPKTAEPPLLDPSTALRPQAVQPGGRAPAQFPTGPASATNTSLAKFPKAGQKTDDVLDFRPSIPRPLPQGPVFSTAVPQETARPASSSPPATEADGPPLTPFPVSPSSPPAATPVPAPPPF